MESWECVNHISPILLPLNDGFTTTKNEVGEKTLGNITPFGDNGSYSDTFSVTFPYSARLSQYYLSRAYRTFKECLKYVDLKKTLIIIQSGVVRYTFWR